MTLLERWAMCFAWIAHYSTAKSRYRKYTGKLYFTHLKEVVGLLMDANITEKHMLAAAWLHDTVEDVWWVNFWLLELLFDAEVTNMVRHLTDVSKPTDGNRRVRKALDCAHIADAPHQPQTIKLADIISNSRSIVVYDSRFAVTYMAEKRDMLAIMKRGNRTLHAMATEIVDNYYKDHAELKSWTIHPTNLPKIKIQDVHPEVLSELDRQERGNKT